MESCGNIYGVASRNLQKPTSTLPCDVPQLQSQGAVGSGGGMMSQTRKGDGFTLELTLDVFLLLETPCENKSMGKILPNRHFHHEIFGFRCFVFAVRWMKMTSSCFLSLDSDSRFSQNLEFHPIPWCLSRCSSQRKKRTSNAPNLSHQKTWKSRHFVVLGLILTSRGA